VAKDLIGMIDALADLNNKIDAVKTDISRNQMATITEFGKIQMGLVAIAWLKLAQMLSSILTFLK
jgi:hypothetical protein